MRSRIAQLMGVEYKFDLMLSTDGSGRGAALVAAVLKNQQVKFLLLYLYMDVLYIVLNVYSVFSMWLIIKGCAPIQCTISQVYFTFESLQGISCSNCMILIFATKSAQNDEFIIYLCAGLCEKPSYLVTKI